MASKFHNVNGLLLFGFDYHFGQHWPTPIPFFMPFWELTGPAHPFWMGGNQKPSVQIMGVNAVVDKHAPALLWLHFPFIPDPLNMWVPLDILFGSHQCWLPRTTVYIEDEWAAPTVYCILSINLDCWSYGHIPSSLIRQLGTVETTPSWKDFLLGVLRAAVNLLISYILFLATGGGKVSGGKGGMIGWDRVGDGIEYVLTHQRARTTLMNSIGRGFLSRLNPFDEGIADATPLLMSTLGIDIGDIAARVAAGQPLKSPSASLGEVGANVVKGVVPASGAIEGIYQHWFQ